MFTPLASPPSLTTSSWDPDFVHCTVFLIESLEEPLSHVYDCSFIILSPGLRRRAAFNRVEVRAIGVAGEGHVGVERHGGLRQRLKFSFAVRFLKACRGAAAFVDSLRKVVLTE